MLRRIVLLVGAVIVFIAGAISTPLLSAQAGSSSLPAAVAIGDQIFIQGSSADCKVTAINGDWVQCAGSWRNLVTGSGYMVQAKGR